MILSKPSIIVHNLALTVYHIKLIDFATAKIMNPMIASKLPKKKLYELDEMNGSP